MQTPRRGGQDDGGDRDRIDAPPLFGSGLMDGNDLPGKQGVTISPTYPRRADDGRRGLFPEPEMFETTQLSPFILTIGMAGALIIGICIGIYLYGQYLDRCALIAFRRQEGGGEHECM